MDKVDSFDVLQIFEAVLHESTKVRVFKFFFQIVFYVGLVVLILEMLFKVVECARLQLEGYESPHFQSFVEIFAPTRHFCVEIDDVHTESNWPSVELWNFQDGALHALECLVVIIAWLN